MAVKSVKSKPENASDLEWSVDNEVQLFLAMTGHKPVGVNKYFHMLCIKEKFVSSVHKEVRREAIWNHLNTLYDMQALDDFEHLPFPNPEKEFSLPDSEFASLMKEKLDESILNNEITPELELDTELKREVKRELQVYKGMKDIKKENRDEIAKGTSPVPTMEFRNFHSAAGSNLAQLGSPPHSKKTILQDKKSGKDKESKKDVKSPASSQISKPSTYLSRNSLEKDSKLSPKSRLSSSKKDSLVKELNSVEEPPKRNSSKRSWPTRGSVTDSASTKSASPITTPTPPPSKRRRI